MPAIPASHADLLTNPHLATLSTLGTDGYPQVTALWVLLDGDVVRTSVVPSRQKYKNVVDHPQATLFVVDPANPYRTLEIRADVGIEPDPELALLDRLLHEYGTDLDSFSRAAGRSSGPHPHADPRRGAGLISLRSHPVQYLPHT